MANALTVIKSLGDWNSRKSESKRCKGSSKAGLGSDGAIRIRYETQWQ